MMRVFILFLTVVIIQSCKSPVDVQEVVDRSIKAHGMSTFDQLEIRFIFREYGYSIQRDGEQYTYTREKTDSIGRIRDVLVNSVDFQRYINNQPVEVGDEWESRYGNSLNSVLYFFQIPYVLNDKAVIKEFVKEVSINGENYFAIKVTFQSVGGGEDFQDEYRYWIHQSKGTVDYLAYNYETEGGGTRFRVAINRRTIDGIVFQDYINYKPQEKFPPLDELPALFENDELDELSRIINKDISVKRF
jgi:hypothetical protein